jgi:hypothetical protein
LATRTPGELSGSRASVRKSSKTRIERNRDALWTNRDALPVRGEASQNLLRPADATSRDARDARDASVAKAPVARAGPIDRLSVARNEANFLARNEANFLARNEANFLARNEAIAPCRTATSLPAPGALNSLRVDRG